MFAVLAEHVSDVDTIKALVKRAYQGGNVSVRGKGFNGGSELLRNGSKQIQLYRDLHNCDRFIICHDADEKDEEARRKEIYTRVIVDSGVRAKFCAVVPVRTIESWILSDTTAFSKIFAGWRGLPEVAMPEALPNPKAYIEQITRNCGGKYRYINAVHNQRFAEHLNLDSVFGKCASSRPFFDFVRKGVSNVPLRSEGWA